MENDSYFDNFLDDNDLLLDKPKSKELPDWVSKDNSSYAAYQAILSLEKEKKLFIKNHKLKSQYIAIYNYQINKSEVGRIVGKNPQPLFYSNLYSEGLRIFFDNTNKSLEKSKVARINSSQSGIGNMRKDDLVLEHKALIKTHENSSSKLVDDVYQKLIDNMPLDVKRKLRID
ncbi:MAG TPA: hypothetical protein DEO86_22900 [Colwellia sp.]|nr:hypothetical protein [Colwellia sp.]|tara:strand:- start:1359 stop:1877 length:519 start_codon:yes stop_codon:yes gene_type:complete